MLDRIPAMSDSDRIAWDPTLIWVLSACVLQEKFKMDLTTPGDDLFDEDSVPIPSMPNQIESCR